MSATAAVRLREERQGLLADVDRWRGVVRTWTLEWQTARDTADELRGSIGALLLDSVDDGRAAAERLASARVDADLAKQALSAAEPRLQAAREVALENFAREYDLRADDARARLREHELAAEKLVARLSRHAGTPISTETAGTKTYALRQEIALEELRADVIRDVAAGTDPARRISDARESRSIGDVALLEVYTSSIWGPRAVIPAPAFERAVSTAEAALAAHESEMAREDADVVSQWEAVVARWDEQEAALKLKGRTLEPDEEEARQYSRGQARARASWREGAETERRRLKAALDELTGNAE